jgi:phage tail protein X
LSTPSPEVTVFYLDSDRLTLLHYCDFGNRPQMLARPSADGKTVEFDLMDAPGSNQVGHVSHAVFTVIDANHPIEDWTFTLANGTLVHGRMDFKRTQ